MTLLVMANFVYFISASYINCSNDGSHFALVSALVKKHSLQITDYMNYTQGVDYALKDGRYYSDRTPGTALIAIPFFALGDLLNGSWLGQLLSHHHNLAEVFVIFLPNIAGTLVILLLFMLLRSSFDFAPSLTCSALAAFTTPLWLESTHLFSHILSTLTILAAVCVVVQVRHLEGKHGALFIALAGLLGVASIIEIQNVVFVGCFALYVLLTKRATWSDLSRRKPLGILGVSLLLFSGIYATLLGYNYAAFGQITIRSNTFNPTFAYEHTLRDSLSGNVLVGLDRLFTNTLNRAVIYDWSSGVGNDTPGLFILSPILIPALLGYIFFWREDRPSATLFILLILSEILIVAHHQTVHTRYATTIIPFLLYPLGYLLQRVRNQRVLVRGTFSFALALTAVWSLLRVSYATAHYYGHPPGRMFPFLHELPSYLFFYGMLSLMVLVVCAWPSLPSWTRQ